jgi:hypothetical protein
MAGNLSSERVTLVSAPTRGGRSYDPHHFQQSPERRHLKQKHPADFETSCSAKLNNLIFPIAAAPVPLVSVQKHLLTQFKSSLDRDHSQT